MYTIEFTFVPKMIAAIQRTSEQQMQDTPVLLRYLTYLRILTGEVFIVAIRQQVELQYGCGVQEHV